MEGVMRHLVTLLGSALAGLLCFGALPAQAAPCGSVPKDGGAPARATLALADQDAETVASASFGRDTGERMMTLVFTATGCELTDKLEKPADPPRIGPPKDTTFDAIPRGVVRLDGDPEVDGSRYIVRLKVSTSPAPIMGGNGELAAPVFEPGTYAGFLNLQAPWVRRVGTPIAISRSDDEWFKVALLAGLGALAGFLAFVIIHWFAQADMVAGRWRFLVAGLLSVLVGAGVAYTTNYLNQGVWTFSANGRALLVAAFTAATAGPLVTGLLGKVYDDNTAVAKPMREAKKDLREKVRGEKKAAAREQLGV
jgi:hypothetical protein